MKHMLRICVLKEPQDGEIIGCHHVIVRKRLLRFLLGDKRKLTVIVPGDSVKALYCHSNSLKLLLSNSWLVNRTILLSLFFLIKIHVLRTDKYQYQVKLHLF